MLHFTYNFFTTLNNNPGQNPGSACQGFDP